MKFIKTKLNRVILAVSALLLGVAFLAVPVSVSAQGSAFNAAREDACQGVSLGTGSCDSKAAAGGLNKVVTTAINVLSLVIGIIAVIVLIIGGLKYITSGGDSNNVTSAKNTILYAIVGLIIVALAQVIVRYVLNQATR